MFRCPRQFWRRWYTWQQRKDGLSKVEYFLIIAIKIALIVLWHLQSLREDFVSMSRRRNCAIQSKAIVFFSTYLLLFVIVNPSSDSELSLDQKQERVDICLKPNCLVRISKLLMGYIWIEDPFSSDRIDRTSHAFQITSIYDLMPLYK